jgi:hypothetical protein
MADSFNGYHVWLGIPPSEQPPNHYRLLGIAIFESDPDVIDHAADRQMAHVRTFQAGRHGALSQQILNELAAARVCLLHPERKREYDAQLRAKLSASVPVAAVPVAKAVPVAQPITVQVAAVPHPSAPPKPDAQIPPVAASPPVAQPIVAPVATAATTDDGILGLAPEKPAPVKPVGKATPVPVTVAAPPSAPVAAAKKTPQDSDPFGLASASAWQPMESASEELFNAQIHTYQGGGGNLSRTRSTDALIQKLAIGGFVVVASLVMAMLFYQFVVRTFGPPGEWFGQPAAVEPHVAPGQEVIPAAPAPAPAPPPAPSPA